MGRDIHFYVEQRDGTGWRRAEELDADGMFTCERCQGACIADGGGWIHVANSEQLCPPDETEQRLPPRQSWYRERSNAVLSALAFGWLTVMSRSGRASRSVEQVRSLWATRNRYWIYVFLAPDSVGSVLENVRLPEDWGVSLDGPIEDVAVVARIPVERTAADTCSP